MEDSTTIDQSNSLKLELQPDGVKSLNEMRKWTMFLAILGFIGIGFLLLAAVLMGTIFGMIDVFGDDVMPNGIGIFISLLYIILAVLYFFPVYYLLQFSTKAKKAIQEASNDEFNNSITFLKSHYKFIGIMTIVVMAVYPILIILLVAGGILAGM